MEATKATMISLKIEKMIVAYISASMSGKISNEEFTINMQDYKRELSEILETL